MDDKPIIPGDSFAGGFRFGNFKLREIIIGACVAVAVVLCFVFVGLYATNSSGGDDQTGNSQSQNAGTTDTPVTTSKPVSLTCDSPLCMETTAYVRSFMNTSVDPCEDFYTYACAVWPTRNPPDTNEFAYYINHDVMHKLYHDNDKKIRRLIDKDVVRNIPWSSERKVRDLYKTCMDDYGRMAVGGNPFVDKILRNVGGWSVLEPLPSDWNILKAIEKIHVDYWTDVLFRIYVGSVYSSRPTFGTRYRRRIIAIRSGGLGMYSTYYYLSNSPYIVKLRTDYQNYMRTVGGLLARDYGVSADQATINQRLDTFVSDVMSFETALANISRTAPRLPFGYYNRYGVSLKDLNNQTHNVVDWVSLLSYFFDQTTITQYTRVQISNRNYIIGMANYINTMPNRNRVVNNYFIWQLARNYVRDLSYEYIHAERQYYNDRYGSTAFPDQSTYCFMFLSTQMDVAMSHLFIKDHFSDKNKAKVEEIASYVKKTIIKNLGNVTFMDDTTRNYAKSKLKATIDKLGYPNWMMDNDQVDLIYYGLNVSSSDFFHNVLEMNKYHKLDMNNQLTRNTWYVDRTDWRGNIFDSYAYFYQPWNELMVPAGLLQFPIYDVGLPHYLNFGSMGSIIGTDYLDAIDKIGSIYRLDGSIQRQPRSRYLIRRWWTDDSVANYQNASQCLINFYINKTSSVGPDGVPRLVNKYTARYYVDTAAQEVGGLKQAYYAYQAWQNDNGREKMPPVVDLTTNQMFFIAYAQTKCYVQKSATPYMWWYSGIPGSLKVNGAVAMLDEFSQAFNCPAMSTLNPPDKCSVF